MKNIPLTRLPTCLSDAGFDPPNYRRCYEMARSAALPVTQQPSGRWTFQMTELQMIATYMELKRWDAD